ncbi:hypothetical protein PAECIP111893_04240 [Paenibacillus plantiphilus]|uniref:Uncharacterized protein n=1 Tax=Paenibacillus plantiphilus TaxID=2905650 RepID=A0ABN8GSQ0_9BACL|nr:hypothetical protein [Paenibacillus plantiphilus]CAH1217240.1 hypothetical protein PAECIP111893_04240 [Paenibacillus plantiphilus]
MNPKQIIIVGTIAIVITLSGGIWTDKANAKPKNTEAPTQRINIEVQDALLHLLGVSSNEEMQEALYNGKSLADITKDNNGDIRRVIALQLTEMTEQLDQRLTQGSITLDQYRAQRSELAEIVTRSVYGLPSG